MIDSLLVSGNSRFSIDPLQKGVVRLRTAILEYNKKMAHSLYTRSAPYMASYRDHKDEIIAWKTSFNSFKVLRAADLIFLLLSLLLVSLKLMGL